MARPGEPCGDVCHMPNCRRPLATMTLCAAHAAKLLDRRPDEPPDEAVEAREAA